MARIITTDRRLAGKPHLTLKVDDSTGLAWIEDTSSGTCHSAHPNISVTGNLRAYKKRYGLQDCVFKRQRGFYHNTSYFVASSPEDRIAASHCRCGGNHGAVVPVNEKGQPLPAEQLVS